MAKDLGVELTELFRADELFKEVNSKNRTLMYCKMVGSWVHEPRRRHMMPESIENLPLIPYYR